MEADGIAVVTGASRGIGRAVAVALAQAGFDVVATMRDPADGAGLVGEVAAGSGSIRAARLDVTDPTTIVVPDGLRVLVNNAGVDTERLPIEHHRVEAWRTAFETNVFGLLAVTQAAIPKIREAGGGVVCNITSAAVFSGVPLYAAYRASKAAVVALGESLRAEVAGFGIRVVDVAPGPVESDMLRESDRQPEAAAYAQYADMAQEMWDGRRAVVEFETPAADAAAAICEAILSDDPKHRWSCDPLGRDLLAAWRADPESGVGP